MNFKWIAFAAVAALALTGCASTPRMSVSDGWNDRPGSISVAYEIPIIRGLEDDLDEDFPEASENFSTWFAEQLKKQLVEQTGIPADKINVVERPHVMGEFAFEHQLGKLGEDMNNFPICKNVEGMPEADLYVCIEGLDYKKIYANYGYGGGLIGALIGMLLFTGELSADGAYSIYDGNHRLAFGNLKAGDEFIFGMGRGNWYNSVENIVKNMIEETPLQK